MSRGGDERDDWTLDSEGGSRASVARSDGRGWIKLSRGEAAKEKLILGIDKKRDDGKGRN